MHSVKRYVLPVIAKRLFSGYPCTRIFLRGAAGYDTAGTEEEPSADSAAESEDTTTTDDAAVTDDF